MRSILMFMLMPVLVFGGEVQKAVADHDIAVAKAKEVFEKASAAAKTKLTFDLKAIMKRSTTEKVDAAKEILKIDTIDEEAIAILNKEGKLAEIGVAAEAIDQFQNKAVYKLWSDKTKLDYLGTGVIDMVQGGGGVNGFFVYKNTMIKAAIEITIPGEYKIHAEGHNQIVVTFLGKRLECSRPTIVMLPKGKHPIMIEVNNPPKSFSIKFGPKANASMDVLAAPYLVTDTAALKEAMADPLFKPKEPKK